MGIKHQEFPEAKIQQGKMHMGNDVEHMNLSEKDKKTHSANEETTTATVHNSIQASIICLFLTSQSSYVSLRLALTCPDHWHVLLENLHHLQKQMAQTTYRKTNIAPARNLICSKHQRAGAIAVCLIDLACLVVGIWNSKQYSPHDGENWWFIPWFRKVKNHLKKSKIFSGGGKYWGTSSPTRSPPLRSQETIPGQRSAWSDVFKVAA